MLKLVSLVIITTLFLFYTPELLAWEPRIYEGVPQSCNDGVYPNYVNQVQFPYETISKQDLIVQIKLSSKADPTLHYYVSLVENTTGSWPQDSAQQLSSDQPLQFTIKGVSNTGKYTLKLMHNEGRLGNTANQICYLGTVTVHDAETTKASCQIIMPEQIKRGENIGIMAQITPLKTVGYFLYLFNQNNAPSKNSFSGINSIFGPRALDNKIDSVQNIQTNDMNNRELKINQLINGNYIVMIEAKTLNTSFVCSSFPFIIGNTETTNPINNKKDADLELNKKSKPTFSGGIPCDPSTGNEGSGNGIMTAIGCVPTEPSELIKGLLRFAVGIGGGLALLLMIYGSFQMITSQGNPDALKKGSDQLTNAVIGLLFIIFSVMLFKVIGIDILEINALVAAFQAGIGN